MEDELTPLLMAVFFRWVAVSEREVSDEHRRSGGPGYNEKEPLVRVYPDPGLRSAGRT